MTPETFAQTINAWGRRTMSERHRTQVLTVGKRRAVALPDLKPRAA